MKKLFIYSLVLSSACVLHAMEKGKDILVLPNANVLTHRLHDLGLDHFMEKTDIVKQLAGQEKAPMGVVMAVELAIYDYRKCVKMPIINNMMQMTKPNIIKAILEDHPIELECLMKELKKEGIV